MPKTKLAKVAMTPRGEWAAATAYETLDLVSYGGSSWIAKKPSSGVTPEAGDYWSLSAAKGDTGAQGEQGIQGVQGEKGSDAEVTKTNIETALGYTPASVIDILFRLQRTGKVYTVKIPRFAVNQTTTCEKLDDNAGLVCVASTDTAEGQDDYADIPLFKWYNCNYVREANGHAIPIAIEGIDEGFTMTGNVDVGVIQMTPFVKWDESNSDYVLLSITDSPKDGFIPWKTAKYGDTVYSYVIHSKYFSVLGEDGLPRSQHGKIIRKMSHNAVLTNYQKKGAGYWGAGVERNSWQILFQLIKYATKSSQTVFYGYTNNSFQYSAAVQRSDAATYFPVTASQASNILVGTYVSVGYGIKSGTSVSTDRSYDSIHAYADDVKVLSKETMEDGNVAIYLDVDAGFNTTTIDLGDGLTAPITLSSMCAQSGSTDVLPHHCDGSPVSNTNGKFAYRIQGCEYGVGVWVVASDTITCFSDDSGNKVIYVAPNGVAHTSGSGYKSTYVAVGSIVAGDWTIGDLELNVEAGAFYSATKGSSTSIGVGDYNYGGGTPTANTTREYLMNGNLRDGSLAGSASVVSSYGLGAAYWDIAAAD